MSRPDEVYRPAPGVRWAVGTRGVDVVDPATDRVLRLDYPEAAIWDLASRGYRADKLAELVAAIAGTTRAGADDLIRGAVRRWAGLGLLTREGGDG